MIDIKLNTAYELVSVYRGNTGNPLIEEKHHELLHEIFDNISIQGNMFKFANDKHSYEYPITHIDMGYMSDETHQIIVDCMVHGTGIALRFMFCNIERYIRDLKPDVKITGGSIEYTFRFNEKVSVTTMRKLLLVKYHIKYHEVIGIHTDSRGFDDSNVWIVNIISSAKDKMPKGGLL